MSSTDHLRGKIHAGAAATTSPRSPAQRSPDLTIEIPKPATSQAQSTPVRPKLKPNANHKPPELDAIPQVDKTDSEAGFQTYREKLLDTLGSDYEGVERYRLEQDEAKERHWKRWGPYLSERQWVGGISHHKSMLS